MFDLKALLQKLWFGRQAPVEGESQHSSEPVKLPSAPPLPPEPAQRKNLRRDLHNRAFERGHKVAIASGARIPDSGVVTSLQAEALAMAQSMHRPASPLREERRIARLKLLAESQQRRELACERAGIECAKAKASVAALGPSEPVPAISPELYLGALVGLGLSVAPSIHAILGGLDGLLRWIVAGLCAFGVSLFIVHGIIPNAPGNKPERS